VFYLFELAIRAYLALLKWAVRSVAAIFLGIRDSFLWGYQSLRERPIRLLGLLAILVPIGILVRVGCPEWFLKWPVVLFVALALLGALKWPFSTAPSFLRKIVKLGIATCLLAGWTMLLQWEPLVSGLGLSRRDTFWPWLVGNFCFAGAAVWIVFKDTIISLTGHRSQALVPRQSGSRKVRFADVGGMEQAKQQIRELVESRLHPGKYRKYGAVRNGILLYGPQGSGKTFLAEATAGEFKLRFHYVSCPELQSIWKGETSRNVRDEFARAIQQRPVLFFVDELDSLGGSRQTAARGGDPTGSGREFNTIVTQLMQSIDQYRGLDGFVLMAASNLLDGLDPALIREGRFDVKIRVGLPDEASRLKILETQLSTRPCRQFDLQEFARRTPGASAARLKALVDRAAASAATERRKIEEADLRQAIGELGGKDRPFVQAVHWNDLVLEEDVAQDLRTLIQLLNDPEAGQKMRLPMPTGLLLLGPPGTGKTMIARLIASETRRSFYPLTAADVLGSNVGDSVKRIAQVFGRAKENNPSLIFVDEMDGLLPRATSLTSQHDTQVTEQFLIEISNLHPEQNVFLVGTTNHPDRIDPRVLRGGRFSEKIEIGLPGRQNRERLLQKYLDGIALGPDAAISTLADRLDNLSPADLEAISKTARRFAFNRAPDASELPPLIWADFEKAAKRVRGTVFGQ
jgi:transitional endoplasmic reticulum ATPase